jgi:hypothetical protein
MYNKIQVLHALFLSNSYPGAHATCPVLVKFIPGGTCYLPCSCQFYTWLHMLPALFCINSKLVACATC